LLAYKLKGKLALTATTPARRPSTRGWVAAARRCRHDWTRGTSADQCPPTTAVVRVTHIATVFRPTTGWRPCSRLFTPCKPNRPEGNGATTTGTYQPQQFPFHHRAATNLGEAIKWQRCAETVADAAVQGSRTHGLGIFLFLNILQTWHLAALATCFDRSLLSR
jgi:hypothetical protein